MPTLRTYRDDVVLAVKQGASVTSIAAAEAVRRAKAGAAFAEEEPPQKSLDFKKLIIWVGAAVLILSVVGGVAGFAISLRGTQEKQTVAFRPAEFMFVERAAELPVGNLEKAELLQLLSRVVAAGNSTLGALEQYYLTRVVAEEPQLLSAQEFLFAVGAEVPESLPRSLEQPFFFGVHIFNGNQPLLIFKTNSYENAFAGMLSWEGTLQRDLAPAFGTALGAADLEQTGTTTASITPRASFRDMVIRNKDARVLRNRTGQVVLLYSFIDRSTLLITTNEYTLNEAVSRLQAARLP